MPHQDEPEIRVDLSLERHLKDVQSPSGHTGTAIFKGMEARWQNTNSSNGCTIHGLKNAENGKESFGYSCPRSVVEETQFDDLELDTQGTDIYDVDSLNAQRILTNTAPRVIPELSQTGQKPFLEKRSEEVPDKSGFRYAKPTKLRPEQPTSSGRYHTESGITLPPNCSLPRRGEIPSDLNSQMHVPSLGLPQFDKAVHQSKPTATSDSEAYLAFDPKPLCIADRPPAAKPELAGVPTRSVYLTKPPFSDVLNPVTNIKERNDTLVDLPDEITPSCETSNAQHIAPINDKMVTGNHRARSMSRRTLSNVSSNTVSDEVTTGPNSMVEPADDCKIIAICSFPSANENDTGLIEKLHETADGKVKDEPTILSAFSKDHPYQSRNPLHDVEQNRHRSELVKEKSSRLRKGEISKISANRPLSTSQLQPQDASQDHIHSSKITKASTRIRESSRILPVDRCQPSANIPCTSMEALQMVMVLINEEQVQRENGSALSQHRETTIIELNEEKTNLQEQIRNLNFENGRLVEKFAKLKSRADGCKQSMHDVIMTQNQLCASMKKWDQERPAIVDAARQELNDVRDEARKNRERAEEIFAGKAREALKKAGKKLDCQEERIDILQKDLSSQLLSLQRERKEKENLQKQLDEAIRDIKTLLSEQKATAASQLDLQEGQIVAMLNAVVQNNSKVGECLVLINDIKGSEPKTLLAIEEITRLLEEFSRRTDDRLQTVEHGSTIVRKAGEEVLTELKGYLSMISGNQEAQRLLSDRIEGILAENAMLKERLLSRQSECVSLSGQLDERKRELETCQDQLISTTEMLKKAPPEDLVLQGQLHDLQEMCSNLKNQAASCAMIAEKANVELHTQTELSRLAQEQVIELRLNLEGSQAELSRLQREKVTHDQRKEEEAKMLRIQMERNFKARLDDDAAHHSGIVFSLQRQISDSESKLVQAQRQLEISQQTISNNAGLASKLRGDIANLEVCTGKQNTELNRFKEELRSKSVDAEQAANELRLSREQLTRCEKEAEEWRTQAETNASLFARRCKESDEGLKSRGKIEIEIGHLQEQLAKHRQKDDDFKSLKNLLMELLRKKGVLDPKMTLEDWAVLNTRNPSECVELATIHLESSRNGSSTPQLSSKDSRASNYSMGVLGNTGSVPYSNNDIENRTGGEELISCPFKSAQSTELELDAAGAFANDDGQMLAPEMNSTIFQGNLAIAENTSHKLYPLKSAHIKKAPENGPGPRISEAVSARVPIHHSPHHLSAGTASAASLPMGARYHLIERRIPSQTVIPDSQDEVATNQMPCFPQSSRRVAQRSARIVTLPWKQDGNRTITRTEFTEYSVRTSETYEAAPANRKSEESTTIGRTTSGVRPRVTEVESNSPFSSPLSMVDSNEFPEDWEDSEQKGINWQPNMDSTQETIDDLRMQDSQISNASYMLPVARLKKTNSAREMRPPKSILKRTNSVMQDAESVFQSERDRSHSNDSSQPLKVISRQAKAAAKKRLSRPTTTNRGLDRSLHNPYNRIVTGMKEAFNGGELPVTNRKPQSPTVSADSQIQDVSSPILGQPQRNSKKRSLSNVGNDDQQTSIKLQRVSRR